MSILGRIMQLGPRIDGIYRRPPARTPEPEPTTPEIITIQDENRLIEEYLANRDTGDTPPPGGDTPPPGGDTPPPGGDTPPPGGDTPPQVVIHLLQVKKKHQDQQL